MEPFETDALYFTTFNDQIPIPHSMNPWSDPKKCIAPEMDYFVSLQSRLGICTMYRKLIESRIENLDVKKNREFKLFLQSQGRFCHRKCYFRIFHWQKPNHILDKSLNHQQLIEKRLNFCQHFLGYNKRPKVHRNILEFLREWLCRKEL